jgi:hypothetical protein
MVQLASHYRAYALAAETLVADKQVHNMTMIA